MGRAVKLDMRLDVSETSRAFADIRRRAPRAIVRAQNRAAKSARTVMVRAVAGDMRLKQSVVRNRIMLELARSIGDSAVIVASRRRIPLIQFRARASRRGVRASLPGGKGRYGDAFIATMRSGHRGVFRRRGRRRLPIAELHGPSVGHVFDRHVAAGESRAREAFHTNLRHELRFALG